MLLEKILEAKNNFLSRYNTPATHVYLGKDVMFILEEQYKDDLRRLGEGRGIVPWRYMQIFNMQVIPVDMETYFAVGFATSIMYDV